MPSNEPLREELVFLLDHGNAHMSFEEAVADYPMEQINAPFPNGGYSSWHLLEHLRLTQWDILDFIRNPHYQERAWPQEYWPPHDQQASPDDWQRTIHDFLADRQALRAIIHGSTKRPVGADSPGRRADNRTGDYGGGRPQRLPPRRVRHHAASHGYLGADPSYRRLNGLTVIGHKTCPRRFHESLPPGILLAYALQPAEAGFADALLRIP